MDLGGKGDGCWHRLPVVYQLSFGTTSFEQYWKEKVYRKV